MDKFVIKVKAEYVGCYEVQAKDLLEAKDKAKIMLYENMNDQVDASVDFEGHNLKDLNIKK
jgi:hypothetical protein